MKRRANLIRVAAAFSLAAALAFTLAAARTTATSSLVPGKAQLTSAGPLAFGPDGVLFVGDSIGAQVVALDTNDHTAPKSGVKIDAQGIDRKIAALVGVAPDQIVINDMKVNPVSKNVYLSASRGRGPDAMPLIARVNAEGNVSLLSLDNIPHASVSLADAPKEASGARNPRMMTITDMNYVDGDLMVAGLSNEEWSSALRSIPFPFKKAEEGATLQIWHASHGRYETQAPVRTFVPYTIQGQQYVLAAYTCTPLVKIPVSDLKPGAKVKGVTIADLGSGNQPLDMVPYKKNGHDYILVANTSLGMLKLKADNLETYKPIDSPTVTDVAGVPYDSLKDLRNVQQLAQLTNTSAVILTGKPGPGPAYNPGPAVGPLNIQTIALP
ncbi:MAG TPA: hypothetical protein VJ732_11730 [Bryobacteraceae bacterium]|nr:hypothetical protein [Bryobacteraceae bacterium]